MIGKETERMRERERERECELHCLVLTSFKIIHRQVSSDMRTSLKTDRKGTLLGFEGLYFFHYLFFSYNE